MGRYFLVIFLLAASSARAACPASVVPDVSGVLNAKTCGALETASDNAAAFASGIATVGATGTLFIPKGTYTYNSAAFAMTKANCNVTIRGDSEGGTYLKPNFSNGSAISFIDAAAETPPNCHGGVRDISFLVPSSVPTSQNLIRVSNVLGLTFQNIYAQNFAGAGDSMFYMDAGSSPTTTFTERITILNARSLFNTNFVTLDGKNTANSSLNNNEIIGSHCDPAGTGACLNIINMANAGSLGGSYFEFNADMNAAGQSIVQTDHRADDQNGTVEFRIRAQSTVLLTNYCLNAPAATGTWVILGYVQCIGVDIVAEKNGNAVSYITH